MHAQTATRKMLNGQDSWEGALAKYWAVSVKNYRNRGGYIYGQNAIERAEGLTSHSRYTGFQGWRTLFSAYRTPILDFITRELTGARDFHGLLATEPGNRYRPTISVSRHWKWEALADAYDAAQQARGDARRAYRI